MDAVSPSSAPSMPPGELRRGMRALSRVMLRMVLRRFVHEVRHTPNGKLGLLLGGFAVFAASGLVRGSAAVAERYGGDLGMGALVLAQASLVLGFALAVLASLTQAFFLEREADPLRAHPVAAPVVAAHRVLVVAIGIPAVWLLVFFYAFHWALVAQTVPDAPVALVLLLHLAGTAALLFAVGVATGALFRAVALRADRWAATAVHRATAVATLAAFVALPLLPRWAAREAPEGMAAFGAMAGGYAGLVFPPHLLAAWGAAGRWEALVPAGVLAAVLFAAVRAFRRWLRAAPVELALEPAAEGRRRYAPRIAVRGRAGFVAQARLFWQKDVAGPLGRERGRWFAEMWGLLTIAGGILAVAAALHARGRMDAPLASALVLGAALTAPALLAARIGLPSLGMEGPQLALLRPVLSGPALFARKLAVAAAHTVPHALLIGLLVAAATAVLRVPSPPAAELALAPALVALPAAFLATALGFWLPDLARRGTHLPGSTTAGRTLYGFLALYAVAVAGLSQHFRATGALEARLHLGTLAGGALVVSAIALGITGLALHRFHRLEG